MWLSEAENRANTWLHGALPKNRSTIMYGLLNLEKLCQALLYDAFSKKTPYLQGSSGKPDQRVPVGQKLKKIWPRPRMVALFPRNERCFSFRQRKLGKTWSSGQRVPASQGTQKTWLCCPPTVRQFTYKPENFRETWPMRSCMLWKPKKLAKAFHCYMSVTIHVSLYMFL